MIDRLTTRVIFSNSNNIYKNYLEEKGLKSIQQYNTAVIKYPTDEQLKRIPYREHVWTSGDRLYKLASTYLGDSRDWWIILVFNKIGTEVSIKQGDVIKIPTNISEILSLFI